MRWIRSHNSIADSLSPGRPVAAAVRPKIDDNGNHQHNQVDSVDRVAVIYDPCVCQRCPRKEDKSKQRQQKPVVGVADVTGQEKEECQDNPGSEDEKEKQRAAHIKSSKTHDELNEA